jgi:phage-related protein
MDVGEQSVRLTAVADCYSGVSVGPNRRVTRLCQWQYKGPECGYKGPEPTCNFLLNDAGGCEGRHGNPLKFARFGGFPFLDNSAKLKNI